MKKTNIVLSKAEFVAVLAFGYAIVIVCMFLFCWVNSVAHGWWVPPTLVVLASFIAVGGCLAWMAIRVAMDGNIDTRS